MNIRVVGLFVSTATALESAVVLLPITPSKRPTRLMIVLIPFPYRDPAPNSNTSVKILYYSPFLPGAQCSTGTTQNAILLDHAQALRSTQSPVANLFNLAPNRQDGSAARSALVHLLHMPFQLINARKRLAAAWLLARECSRLVMRLFVLG